MNDFTAFKDWLLISMLGGLGGMGIGILWKIFGSIQKLNLQVAVIIADAGGFNQKLNDHDMQLDGIRETTADHESRLSVLESINELEH